MSTLKQTLLYALLCCTVIFSFTACGGKDADNGGDIVASSGPNDPVNSVPANAMGVMSLNIGQMMKKADYESIKQLEFFQAMLKEVDSKAPEAKVFLEKPSELGINMDGNFYMYMIPDATMDKPCIAVLMPLTDKAKFEKALNDLGKEKKPEFKDVNGVMVMEQGPTKVGYSDKLLAITGNASTAQFDAIFKPAENITSNEAFAKHHTGGRDVAVWVNFDPVVDHLSATDPQFKGMVDGLQMVDLDASALKGNSISAYYNFEKGKAEGGAHYEFNGQLAEKFGPLFKDKLAADFTKYVPSNGLISVSTLGLNFDAIKAMVDARGLTATADQQLGAVGLSLEELTSGFGGDIFVASYVPAAGQENSFVAGISVNDPALIDKLKEIVNSTGMLKLEDTEGYITASRETVDYFTDQTTIESYYACVTNDALIVCSNQEVAAKIAAGGYAGAEAVNAEHMATIQGGWSGTYADYEGFMGSMKGMVGLLSMMNPMAGVAFSKMDELEYAVAVAGAKEATFTIHTKSKDTNVLKRIFELANEVYTSGGQDNLGETNNTMNDENTGEL